MESIGGIKGNGDQIDFLARVQVSPEAVRLTIQTQKNKVRERRGITPSFHARTR
jgi:hypothetical protein